MLAYNNYYKILTIPTACVSSHNDIVTARTIAMHVGRKNCYVVPLV